jgi:hypothetical protein
MSKEDRILLTPWGDRVHFHARDNIQAVRIIRLVSENERPLAYYATLTLAVVDEAGLVLWSEELSSFARPDKPQVAVVERDFAVWESLQIAINRPEGGEATVPENQEPVDFLIRLYYTINPETTLNDART